MNVLGTHSTGYLLVLASASCFATAPILIKYAYGLGLTAWQIIMVQSVIASLILLAIHLGRRKKCRLSWKVGVSLATQGIIGSLGTTLFFSFALQFLDASMEIALLYTYPAFVTVGSVVIFRYKVTPAHFVSLGLTLAGMLLTLNVAVIAREGQSLLGILLGLGSAVTYAFYNLWGERNLAHTDPLTVTTFTQLASTIGVVLIKSPLFLAKSFSLEVLAIGFLLAVVTLVIPCFLLLRGISCIGASKAAIVSTFELPITMFLAVLLLKETITPGQLVGAALIIAAIILSHQQGVEKKAACSK